MTNTPYTFTDRFYTMCPNIPAAPTYIFFGEYKIISGLRDFRTTLYYSAREFPNGNSSDKPLTFLIIKYE